MDELDDDIVYSIIKRVRHREDRRSCMLVNKQWYIVEGLTRRTINFKQTKFISKFSSRFPNVEEIKASERLKNEDVELISRSCPKLTCADFSISIDPLPRESNRNYRSDDNIDDLALISLSQGCPKLLYLMLSGRKRICNRGIEYISRNCLNLIYLDLSYCHGISNWGIKVISELQFLKALVLHSCYAFEDISLKHLGTGPVHQSLKSLHLTDCGRLTDKGITYLGGLKALKKLYLDDSGSRITDISLSAISNISTLKTLSLSWLMSLTDCSLEHISIGCPLLKHLVLTGCECISDDGITYLTALKYLKSLQLDYCTELTGQSVEMLTTHCLKLKSLLLPRDLRGWVTKQVNILRRRGCNVKWGAYTS